MPKEKIKKKKVSITPKASKSKNTLKTTRKKQYTQAAKSKKKISNQSPKKTTLIQNTKYFIQNILPQLTMRTKILFLSGAILLLISLGWHLNQTIQLMFFTPKVIAVEKKHAIPTAIKIAKVGLDLPIEQTAINNGVWQIADKGASHLSISARPGEKDTIIMYAHNTNERFGPIRWLNKGDLLEVTTEDKKLHKYAVTETMTVTPDRMDVLTQKRGEALILYTCDGFADIYRFVLVATPNN